MQNERENNVMGLKGSRRQPLNVKLKCIYVVNSIYIQITANFQLGPREEEVFL